MADKRRIVIIGATSAMAEHCARLWAMEGAADFVLVGRNTGKLEQIAADLKVRGPGSSAQCLSADFSDPGKIKACVDDIVAGGNADIVLIAHGHLPDQQACQADLEANAGALNINAVSPVLFAEAFAGHMQIAGRGRLAVIGSVAGDRGRKSNYVYGAAKGLVTRYVQGMQHRFAGSNVKVILVKPGPTDTPMTADMKQKGAKLASVTDVAADIVRGIDKDRAVIFTPAKWALIMLIVRHIPDFIFKRINI